MTQTTAQALTVPQQPRAVFGGVTQEDKFLFDMQGFVILRGAIAQDDVKIMLEEVQRLEKIEHDDSRWRKKWADGRIGQPTKHVDPGWVRLNGLFRMSDQFDRLIDYPTVYPYLQEFMTEPMVCNTWSITKTMGTDAGQWHRGVGPDLYNVRNGQIRTRMLNTVYFLTENGPDDGCMVTVPGGHKSNFDLNFGKFKGLDMPGSIRVTGQPGDVLVFTEALLHNGLGNTSGKTRSNIYFNYIARDFNVMTFSPEHNFHFAMPPSVRERFTAQQKKATGWMEWARTIE
jgi:hypothetical protein